MQRWLSPLIFIQLKINWCQQGLNFTTDKRKWVESGFFYDLKTREEAKSVDSH